MKWLPSPSSLNPSSVYRNATHTGKYLHQNSNHPLHVEGGVNQNLVGRANKICHK
jgi:hypothetical protein